MCDVTSSEDLTCSRRREQTALQLITESQKAFQQASVVIGNHGRICDVVAGSIHVTLVMRTASDLQHLLAEVTSGCVQQRMLTWLIASNRMFSRNDVIRAEVKEDECSSAMRILQEHENSVQNAGKPCQLYTCMCVAVMTLPYMYLYSSFRAFARPSFVLVLQGARRVVLDSRRLLVGPRHSSFRSFRCKQKQSAT